MSIIIMIAVLTGLAIVLLFWALYLGLVARQKVETLSADVFEESASVRYKRMQSLLDESEFEFLSSQAGYTPDLGRRFRASRRRIFRTYLRSMKRDFGRIYLAAKLIMVHSEVDRPDLAKILLRQRLLFTMAMLRVEYRLVLHRVAGSKVDVGGLAEVLDQLQASVRQQMLIPQASVS